MKCSKCGYEGIGFKIVFGSPPCCNAWTNRQCPQCRHIDRFDEMEETRKREERVKELCRQIKQHLEQKQFEQAYKRWDEAVELNRCLGLKEEGVFLSSMAKDVRQWKRKFAANLFQ